MKKLFLVVLYKTLIKDSKTCQFIKSSDLLCDEDNTIYIWDNSPTDINSEYNVKHFFSEGTIVYRHTPENKSLSIIYNTVIKQYSDYDAIQFFDQDSYIQKSNYNEYLNLILTKNPSINLFLPKIYSNGCLYSPGKLIVCKGFHYKTLKMGVNKKRNFTAIGSGILFRPFFCIENDIYISEELKLYSVDTDFIYKIMKKNNSFFLLDVIFEHDLSEVNLDLLGAKKRRKEQLENLLIIYKDEKLKYILTLWYIRLLKLMKMV